MVGTSLVVGKAYNDSSCKFRSPIHDGEYEVSATECALQPDSSYMSATITDPYYLGIGLFNRGGCQISEESYLHGTSFLINRCYVGSGGMYYLHTVTSGSNTNSNGGLNAGIQTFSSSKDCYTAQLQIAPYGLYAPPESVCTSIASNLSMGSIVYTNFTYPSFFERNTVFIRYVLL